MFSHHSPDTVAPPSSNYSHAVHIPSVARWLHISGQVGNRLDGSLAGDTAAQMEECWRRILAILEDADMIADNLVKVTAYLTNADEVGLYREIRDRMLGGVHTASTLVVVNALAHPDWTVEIEAVAAA